MPSPVRSDGNLDLQLCRHFREKLYRDGAHARLFDRAVHVDLFLIHADVLLLLQGVRDVLGGDGAEQLAALPSLGLYVQGDLFQLRRLLDGSRFLLFPLLLGEGLLLLQASELEPT